MDDWLEFSVSSSLGTLREGPPTCKSRKHRTPDIDRADETVGSRLLLGAAIAARGVSGRG